MIINKAWGLSMKPEVKSILYYLTRKPHFNGGWGLLSPVDGNRYVEYWDDIVVVGTWDNDKWEGLVVVSAVVTGEAALSCFSFIVVCESRVALSCLFGVELVVMSFSLLFAWLSISLYIGSFVIRFD